MKEKLPQIVEVKWKDSWTSSDTKWTRKQLEEEPDLILTSAGYLVHQDKRGINLATEYRIENGICRHVHHIPAGLILKIRKVK